MIIFSSAERPFSYGKGINYQVKTLHYAGIRSVRALRRLLAFNRLLLRFDMALPRFVNGMLRTRAIYSVSSRSVVSHEPWKPGPYPKTEEERLAAAKKYGLLPEEYEPYPDDGMGYGDYPKLPDIGQDAKSENYPWDCPEHNRNFGEILHLNADKWGSDKANPNYDENARFPAWQKLLALFSAVFGISGLMITGDYWCKVYKPYMPKQWPQEGAKYFTYSDKYF